MKNNILLTALLICTCSIVRAQPFIANDTNATIAGVQAAFDQWSAGKNLRTTKGWKWYKRFEQHWSERTALGRHAPDLSAYYKATQDISQKKMSLNKTTGMLASWSPYGPSVLPPSPDPGSSHGMGRVNCITFHPTDTNTFWIGVAQGGVWKTTNGGNSWMPLTDNLPVLRISDIAIDPNDVNTMYICVGDYAYLGIALWTDNRKRHTHYGMGIYKTTDGGANWIPTGLTFNTDELDLSLARRVFVNPSNSGHLLAAGIFGIRKSMDAGTTWTTVLDTALWDIEQDPANPNIMYASAAYIYKLNAGTAGIMKSTDFGDTWVWLNTGIPPSGAVQRIELAVSPANSSYVYAVACGINSGFYAFYRSADAGASWTVQLDYTGGLNPLGWYDGQGETGGQGTYDLVILAHPTDANKVFIGGVNLWGSADGGVSWEGCSYWTPDYGPSIHADQHQFKYNTADGKFYICNDGGVFRTDSVKTGSWSEANSTPGYQWPTNWENISSGMQITSFYRLGTSKNNPGYVIAGAQDNSTFFYNNTEWINIIGGDGMDCLIDASNPNILIGSWQYGNFVASYDGGQNLDWNFYYTLNATGENGEWTTPMVMHPSNPSTLFAGYGNLWQTADFGLSWNKISEFPDMATAGFPNLHSAVAVAPSDPNHIYITKRIYHGYNAPSEVWKTSTGGISWDNITAGLPDSLYPTSIAVDDSNPLTAWVTYSGFADSVKVFKTSDGGVSWTNISYNLPNIPVNSVVHHTNSFYNIIYIGTDVGVYYLNDTLTQWQLYSDNLPNVIVSEVEFHLSTNKLYAATFGRGIWVADALPALIVGEQMPELYSASISINPNPSNGKFSMHINGLSSETANVEIVDITGRVVYGEILKTKHGEVAANVDLKLNAGLYFVRISNGTYSRVEKIVLQ